MSGINLFDLMEEQGVEVPKEVKKEVKKSKEKKKKTTVKKAEPIKYTLPFNLYYSGSWYEISKNDFPGKERIDLDELIEHLKATYSFRILKKDRIAVEYDKEENDLIIVLKNPSKGGGSSFFQGLKMYHFADNSYRFIKGDDYGYLVGPNEEASKNAIKVDGFTQVPGVYLSKKIPCTILTYVLRTFADKYPNEVLCQIFFSKIDKEYIMHVPEQKTTTDFITREKGSFFLKDKSNVLLMEIHSHGQYPAIFSRTDDENELDFLIYGVIGELAKNNPTYNFRIGFNGLFHPVTINDLFELEGGSYA